MGWSHHTTPLSQILANLYMDFFEKDALETVLKKSSCGGIGRRLRRRLSFLGRQPDPGGTLPPESRWLLLRLKLSSPFMALGSPELVYAIADPRGQSLNSIFLENQTGLTWRVRGSSIYYSRPRTCTNTKGHTNTRNHPHQKRDKNYTHKGMYAQQQTMTVNYVLNSVPTLFPPSSFPSPLLHFLLGGQTHISPR